MPIIRRKLQASDVYPDDIRYDADTDTVQRLINDDWTDSPESDPRTQTTFPPRLTADTACDAAESVKDAVKGQVDAILTAIDNAATAFTVGGLILGLFTFGVFEIFIAIALAIANAMLDAGTSALAAALTDPVYHTFACILDCHMNTSGRLDAGSLPEIEAEIDDQIGGLAATILNSMLSLAGEGGINNLASLGTSTGDCDDCGCIETWCYDFDFTLSDGGSFVTVTLGTWVGGTGWVGVAYGSGGGISGMVFDFDVAQLRGMEMIHTASSYGGYQKLSVWENTPAAGVNHFLSSDPEVMNGINVHSIYDSFDIENLANRVTLYVDGAGSSNATIHHIKFWGTGTNPFGDNNCESP